MAIKFYKPTSPGRRFMSVSAYEEITCTTPEKSLLEDKRSTGGRNVHGKITVRFRGGAARRKYRIIDFKRNKDGIPAKVATIEYDPNRSANIALLVYADGEKRYIIAPYGLHVGDTILSGSEADIKPGNAMPIANIPLGTLIHCIELFAKDELTPVKEDKEVVSYADAGVDISGMDEDALRKTCAELNVKVEPSMGKGKLIDAIFSEYCEDKLVQPTFVTDYPVEMSPLSKSHRDNPELTERFELFVCGKELANAYSELNDPIDQLQRFEEQARLKSNGDDEAMYIDLDFVRALEYGMPPTCGLGLGIDRLTMFMTGQTTIQDVLFFPQMKPEKTLKKEDKQ